MKIKKILKLFLHFFKIGLFTFGGGYAMIAVMETEFVEKQKWIDKDEFLDVVAISESTPGPIAINSATYIGYKVAKFFGALVATIGVVLPSFAIIAILSFFIDKFNLLDYPFVFYAFKGINVCVAFLIIKAGVKMFFKQKKNFFNIFLCLLTSVVFICFSLFDISFSTVFYILIGGFIGIIIYIVYILKKKGEKK